MTERPFTTETTHGHPLGYGPGHLVDDGSSDYESDPMVEAPPTSETLASVHASDTDVPSSTPPEGAGDTKQVVADEAASVAADAKEGGRRVAETAASEAKDLASEATTQLRQLFSQLQSELTDQASGQSARAVSALRSLADELREMSSGTQQGGVATDLARQASDRTRGLADWLDGREPGDLVEDARDFARRRPGTFLAAAAVIGVIGGRLTRGLTGNESSSDARGAQGGSSAADVSRAQGVAGTAVTSGLGTAYVDQTTAQAAGSAPATDRPTAYDPSRTDAGVDPTSYTHPAAPGQEGDVSGYEGQR